MDLRLQPKEASMPDHASSPSPASPTLEDLTSLMAQVSLDLQAIQRLALLAQQPDLSTEDRIALARGVYRVAGSAGCMTDAAQWPDAASVAGSAGDWLIVPDQNQV